MINVKSHNINGGTYNGAIPKPTLPIVVQEKRFFLENIAKRDIESNVMKWHHFCCVHRMNKK